MTKIIGITGGIGSGKSTFSNQVLKRKYKLFDSDKNVDLLYKKPNKEFLNYLRKIGLGSAIKGKRISKKEIGNVIFSDKKTKSKLEQYIFKIIRTKRSNFIKKEKKTKTNFLFFDIPLLFENKLMNEFDIIISIISSKKERLKRLKISKSMSKSNFEKILKNQTSDIERKKKSDIIIINNSDINSFIKKVATVLDRITK